MEILRMSVSASILILFTVCVRSVFKSRIPKDVMNILWGIVCCRLFLPFSPGRSFRMLLESRIPAEGGYLDKAGVTGVPSGVFLAVRKAAVVSEDVVRIVWMAGAVFFALYFLYTYIRCIRVFRTALPLNDRFRKSMDCGIPGEGDMYRNVCVRISDRIASPLTYGIFHPVILLPKAMDGKDGKNLYYVLTHEVCHIRRWDCARKLCLAAALACHWFNPFVWWMYHLADRDIELACDEMVIRSIGPARRSAYAGVLMEWAVQRTEGNLLASHFAENFMEERIVNIMKNKSLTLAGMALSFALIAGAAVVYAASPAAGEGTETAGTSKGMAAAADGMGMVTVTKTEVEEGDIVSTVYVCEDGYADPTLGGIFELYTPEEYEQVIEDVKKYSDGCTPEDIKNMEADLQRLKADNGKGEFVIYKSDFEKSYEENGAMISEGIDVRIIMAPEQMDRNFTAQEYRKAIEDIEDFLKEAETDGRVTREQKDRILAKMDENLAKFS